MRATSGALFPSFSLPMRQDWVGLTAWGPLFAWLDSGLSWPAGPLIECTLCLSPFAVITIGLATYLN